MTRLVSSFAVALIFIFGCSSTDGDGGGGMGGDGETGGASGAGGRTQIPSEQAQTPEECEWLGAGGDDAWPCDYVTVDFSEPLATSGLSVEVTTSAGDILMPSEPGDPGPNEPPLDPVLFLSLDDAQATGFTITRIAEQPHYSPAEFSVTVQLDQMLVADTTLEPSYSCVEITSDDWCWRGEPLTLTVSP